MRKGHIKLLIACAVLFGVIVVYAQGGFTGSGNSANERGQGQTVTVQAAKGLQDDTKVTLQGNIIRSLGDEKYTFRDATGEITIEIDNKIWKGVTVSENDKVDIFGEVEVKRNSVEIDVKSIAKAK